MAQNVGTDLSSGAPAPPNADSGFCVGRMVNVASRTWPGINKHGGVGRITNIHHTGDVISHVDVQYIVVGGREKRVPIEYVTMAAEYDQIASSTASKPSDLRDRSMLLGRCKRCGSLRADCGSCDWIEQEKMLNATSQAALSDAPVEQRRSGTTVSRKRRKVSRTSSDRSSSSSSSSENEELVKSMERRRRKHLKKKSQWIHFFEDDSTDSSQHSGYSKNISDEESSCSEAESRPNFPREHPMQVPQRPMSRSALRLKQRSKRRETSSVGRASREVEGEHPMQVPEMLMRRSRKPRREHSRRTVDSSVEPLHTNNDDSPSATLGDPQRRVEPDGIFGDPDLSPALPNKSTVDTTPPPPERANRRSSYSPHDEYVYDDGSYLKDFIQPEGTEAAECLPSDTIDRTRDIPYNELVDFFNQTTENLEDVVIPDAKLRLVEFQRKLRNSKEVEGGTSTLAKECQEIYDNFLHILVRDGIDQCSAALSRLDREYKAQKNDLTHDERKKVRGGRESRDLRFGHVSDSAETLLKEAKDVTRELSGWHAETEVWSDSEAGYASLSSGHDTPTPHFQDNYSSADEVTELPAHDPHEHAVRVKQRTSHKPRQRQGVSKPSHSRRSRPPKHALSGNDSARNQSFPGSTATARRREKRQRRTSEFTFVESSGNRAHIPDETNLGGKSGEQSIATDAPDLDDLLEYQGSSKRNTRERIGGSTSMTRSHRSEAPIADRMQSFLNANSSNFSHNEDQDPTDEPEMFDTKRRKRQKGSQRAPASHDRSDIVRSSRQRGQESSRKSSEDKSLPSEETPTSDSEVLSSQFMFQRLDKERSSELSSRTISDPPSLQGSVSDMCQLLLDNYPHAPQVCGSAFRGIQTSASPSFGFKIFETVLCLMKNKGSFTLLEAVHFKRDALRLHVHLLTFTLGLLEKSINGNLEPEHGAVFHLFRAPASALVSTLTLQLVDVVYALCHPCAWACEVRDKRGILEELSPLLNALGKHCSIIESVARCITEKLECQRWLSGTSGQEAYVSSIDPESFKTFLSSPESSGQELPTEENIRYARFKGSLPRCEIEAIWSILAFFAAAPSTNVGECSRIWRLILSLFYSTTGVLSKAALEQPGKVLPPSIGHLSCCESELGHFLALLSVDSMGTIPSSDKLITSLIQKATRLQADAYTLGTSTFYVPSLDRIDRKRIMRIWEATDLLSKQILSNQLTTRSSKEGLIASCWKWPRKRSFLSLLPISEILRHNSGLLSTWIQNVPLKKARWARLLGSIQSLAESCVERATTLEREGETDVQNRDTFAAAFSSKTMSIGHAKGACYFRETAVVAFLIEAVSKILKQRSTSDHAMAPPVLNKNLREKIWDTISDAPLKRRHESQCSGQTADSFDGSIIAIYNASKSMAFLAFLHFGILPCDMDDMATSTISDMLPSGIDDDESMLTYIVSCLITCLDCACDLVCSGDPLRSVDEAIPSISFAMTVACIGTWIAMICTRSRSVLLDCPEYYNKLKKPAEKLAKDILTVVAAPVNRCLVYIAGSAELGESSGVALRSLLAIIRSSMGLKAALDQRMKEMPNQSEVNGSSSDQQFLGSSSDDDPFGDMDDSLFLDINLDTVSGKLPTNEDSHPITAMWSCLTRLLDTAKPSNRFSVLPSTQVGSGDSFSTSVQGRVLLAAHSGAVCATLASIAAPSCNESGMIEAYLNSLKDSSLGRIGAADGDDQTFKRHLLQCFYSEICSLVDSSAPCAQLVIKRRDDVIENFIWAILDSSLLERFPTVHLKRIRNNGGEGAFTKERNRLTAANEDEEEPPDEDSCSEMRDSNGARRRKGEEIDCPGPVYNSANVWKWCRRLGNAFDTNSNGDSPFRGLDRDLPTRSNKHAITELVSLESETLKRIKLFRGVMRAWASRSSVFDDSHGSECLLSVVIFSSAENLLSISEGLQYHENLRPSGTNEKLTYKHAKLLELQSCYVELFTTILSQILIDSGGQHSASFDTVLRYLRDNFLSRILQKHSFDIHESLRQICRLADSTVTGGSIKPPSTASSQKRASLHDALFDACVRRSSEFVHHVSLGYSVHGPGHLYCLHSALISAGACNDMSEAVASERLAQRVASAHAIRGTVTPAISSVKKSSLQDATDDYMHFVQSSRIVAATEVANMDHVRHFAVEKFLSARLNQESIPVSEKKGVLRLLFYMLKVECTPRNAISTRIPLEKSIVHATVKGLLHCLCRVVESASVDNEVVSKIFACAKVLLSLGLIVPPSATSAPATPPGVLYLWSFGLWMKDFGEMISSQTEEGMHCLLCLRKKAVSLYRNGKSIWNKEEDDSTDSDSIVSSWVQVAQLERQVFSPKENVPPVANVYAKSKSSRHVLAMSDSEPADVRWDPSSSVVRAAKELMAEVIKLL